MRITRETLLKVARDSVAQRVRLSRRVVCVYLTGSLLQEEPLLGGTTDIDLFFIHDAEPPVAREVVRLTDEISLDIANLSQAIFHQPRHLRQDPWVGSFLRANPIPLHDTQHWFEFTQASVGAQFNQPDYILQRSRPLADAARSEWMSLHLGSVESGPQALCIYLRSLEYAANAIATLNGTPLTERRFLLKFPERAEAVGRPWLADGLVNLIQADAVDEEHWQSFQAAWKASLEAASQQEKCLPRLNACRLPYYTRAASALFPESPPAAFWLMLRTWSMALTCLPPEAASSSEWQTLLQSQALDESHFEERLEALDAYLDRVEETLDLWAKDNCIE